MRHPITSRIALLSSLLAAAGCLDATATTVTLPIQTAPDFTARVVSTTVEQGFTPEGWISQYVVFVAVPPSDSANAGVILSVTVPVFALTNGTLRRDAAFDIAVGDSIEVWRSSSYSLDAAESPPNSPAYFATQIVIVR